MIKMLAATMTIVIEAERQLANAWKSPAALELRANE
jgi:hypothetical protein